MDTKMNVLNEIQNIPGNHELHFPLISGAVRELGKNAGVPENMAQSVAVSATAAAAQMAVNVKNPRGFVEPTSTYHLIIGDPAAGKTLSFSKFYAGVQLFNEDERKKHELEMKEYAEQLELFNTKKRAIKASICREINEGADANASQEALRILMREQPCMPKKFRPLLEYVTPEAFLKTLVADQPFALLASSEGAAVMDGRTFDRTEQFNQAWGGGPMSFDTKKDGSQHVSFCRFSMCLMTQTERFQEDGIRKLKRGGKNGFNSRLIVTHAKPLQARGVTPTSADAWPSCDAFSNRSRHLMAQAADNIRKNGFNLGVLELSEEAAIYFLDLHNSIKTKTGQGCLYAEAQDHAERLSSNILRTAAACHYFEGFEGCISIETIKAAQVICENASMDYLKFFVPPPREIQDAILLNSWFDRFRQQRATSIPKSYARRHCPNSLRSEGRFNFALGVLVRDGIVTEYLGQNMIQQIGLSNYNTPFLYGGVDIFKDSNRSV